MAWFTGKLGLSPGTLIYVGERPTAGSRVTLTQYSEEKCDIVSADSWAKVSGRLSDEGTRWIHIEGLHDIQMVEAVGNAFGIHQMSMEDILNSHHRPKMSDFESYTHFVAKIVSVNQKGLEIQYDHASVILGDGFVLSFAERKSDFLKPIFDRLGPPDGRLRVFGPAYMAFSLIDLIIDHFYLALSRLEEAVDQMETQILRRPSDLLLGRLYEVKRETALMRKMAIPVRDFIKSLNKNPSQLIPEDYMIYYRDLEDHAVQIVDTCEIIKETLRNLLDVSDSYSAHNMNIMFKFFTVVSAVFLPLNFLASVYGMNFQYMPGLHDPGGFFLMTGAMIAIGLAVAAFFKFKRWL
jgi:magnesium transporter